MALTRERCYDLAKNYTSKGEFQKKNKSVYETARRNGWLGDYTWFIDRFAWTKELCYNEAKKYNSRTEFAKNASRAYEVSRKNGWLDNYVWFEEKQKPAGYWNYDNCYNEAKKYKSRGEFGKNASRAYNNARVNGWLKDYTWFEDTKSLKSKLNTKWTKESCYNEAKKYNSIKDFRESSAVAYSIALKNGWLNEYDWLKRVGKPKGYWNYETCYELSKTCKSKIELERKNSAAYQKARVNGWLKDYTWFEKRAISEKNIYTVYCYKDQDTNSLYVGLTNNLHHRHNQHKFGIVRHGVRLFDTVYKYFNSIGKEVPDPIVLKKDLLAKDAQHYEGHYIEVFKNEGMNVLNLAKSGSLGGIGIWTREKCYNEAKKYKSRKELEKGSKAAYVNAIKNGWINDYTWFKPVTSKPNGYWTKERCYDEAKKYKSRNEFGKNAKRAYQVAHKNGWINDYDWLTKKDAKPSGYYSKEKCNELAKQCKSSSEFKRNYPSAYVAARKNGWIKEYTWFEKLHKEWNYDTCKEEAKKYKSRNEFQRKKGRAYEVSRKNGWIDEFFQKRLQESD